MKLYLQRENSNDSLFLIRDHGGQKKIAQPFSGLKEKNCQPKTLYLAQISFRNEEKIKTFSDMVKLKENFPPTDLF